MQPLSDKALEDAITAQDLLVKAEKPLNFLSSLDWPDASRRKFLDHGKLPQIAYEKIDVADSVGQIKQARQTIKGDNPVFNWLRGIADSLEGTAKLIDARGTPAFFDASKALFGEPADLLLDGETKVIDLARHMDKTLARLSNDKLVLGDVDEKSDAKAFARRLRLRLKKYFGDQAPQVKLSKTMSAKAAAGTTHIHIRSDAEFTDMDLRQLLQHEALVHVATALNGHAQEHFPILGCSHAGTTETQEGLAVFAEVISGAIDPARFDRLSDRVIAIQDAIDGADFKEVFDFYHERTGDRNDAFENARRIFRGGVLTGGAPFTKDMVYLNGLLRIHNYMRALVDLERADLIRLLFVGKLNVDDIPALSQLVIGRHVSVPKFLPPWAEDMRFLVSYLGYSSFLNRVKLPGFEQHFASSLASVDDAWTVAEQKD